MMPLGMETKVNPPQYTRIAVRDHPYLYLKVKLVLECADGESIDAKQFKFIVLQALKENLGAVGAATCVDVLKVLGGGVAILRIPNKNSEKLWAALTLFGKSTLYGVTQRCAFTVLQTSPVLMNLAANSRDHTF